MVGNSLDDKLTKAKELIDRLGKCDKFFSKYSVTPVRQVESIRNDMCELAYSIDQIEVPQNRDELIQSEIKRRMMGDAIHLEQMLSESLYDFNTIVGSMGIPEIDIASLRPWLEENRAKTQEAVSRIFNSQDLEGYEFPLFLDVPSLRTKAEEFAETNVKRYHETLGYFLEDLIKVDSFMKEISAVPTTEGRSYFNRRMKTLAISIPDICYLTENKKLKLREGELIKIYGHEGMGHALNSLLTDSEDLPGFFKEQSHLTTGTVESVAQHYERVLLSDLSNHVEVQKELGIEKDFDRIYQESKDIEALAEYGQRLSYYSISVLSNKELGDNQDPLTLSKKTDIIGEVAISPGFASNFVQRNRYSFDSEGNLNMSLVGELRYCARPVDRALKEFSNRGIEYSGEGRNLIDSTLLTGFWTPEGFVDNARLVAEAHKAA